MSPFDNTREPLNVTVGRGNVFADLGDKDAHVQHAKAGLAAEIIKAMDTASLTVRQAEQRTGFAADDFSCIRNADLGRFTIDRLMRILERLDDQIDIQLTVSSTR